MNGRLREVLVGRAAPFARDGVRSGIDKHSVVGPVRLDALGLAGDEQGDLNVHGGPDKAVHVYAWEHYVSWRSELPGSSVLRTGAAGAFGENFSVDGMNEWSVCIADRWQIGNAIVEVSQGRQPCWKLNHRFGADDTALRVQQTLRSGWYLRVVQPGTVAAGDAIQLVGRSHPDWSVARLLALIRDRSCEVAALQEALALPLTPSWRRLFLRRLESRAVEDWGARLAGIARM